jgi:protein O-GlcNAc transferase
MPALTAIARNANLPPMGSPRSDHAQQLYAAGRLQEAIAEFTQAIADAPDDAEIHCYMGVALKDAGQLDQAIDAFHKAIAIEPDFAEAYCMLAGAFGDAGRTAEAIEAFRHAVDIDPEFAEAWNELGNALRSAGRLDEAIEAFRQASAASPDEPRIHFNLAAVLQSKGRSAEAVEHYLQAIRHKPDLAGTHTHLAGAYIQLGRWAEAAAAAEQAVRLNPNDAAAHFQLGQVYRGTCRLDDAIAAFRRAVGLEPDMARGWTMLAITLKEHGQLDPAIEAQHRAIEINPQSGAMHANLGNSLSDRGDFEAALVEYDRAIALEPGELAFHENRLYTMHYHPGFPPAMIAHEHSQWNQRYAKPLATGLLPHVNDRDVNRRLKIGYVSPDFCMHPVGRFMLPLLDHHNHLNVEVFCFSDVAVPDSLTERAKNAADHWCNIRGRSDSDVASLIRDLQMDVLVDLTMHMRHNRMLAFARKPAPVQVTYLAYVSTTGLDAMDYRLTDPYLDPLDRDESVYSEKSIRLPRTYWCFEPDPSAPPIQPHNTAADGVTFGCLNNFSKVTEAAVRTWASVIKLCPNSRMTLHAPQGSHRQRVQQIFSDGGVDPNRLRFVGRGPMHEYLNTYRSIDIALDPFPYGGGTTSCDAFWMGVPVVTLAGDAAFSRGGVSLLNNIGLPELIARSPDDYIHIATSLAADARQLAHLRSTMRDRMRASPLMDAEQFARDVESAFREMWRRWC